MTDGQVRLLADKVIARATALNAAVATAESCTGGLISAALTDVPGASAVFTHGFVTYANEAKEELLGVPNSLLISHGAVSPQVAKAMATGARTRAKADYAVAVTGIAGPGGGTPEKPVGLVYIGVATPTRTLVHQHRFGARSRAMIRLLTVKAAFRHLLSEMPA